MCQQRLDMCRGAAASDVNTVRIAPLPSQRGKDLYLTGDLYDSSIPDLFKAWTRLFNGLSSCIWDLALVQWKFSSILETMQDVWMTPALFSPQNNAYFPHYLHHSSAGLKDVAAMFRQSGSFLCEDNSRSESIVSEAPLCGTVVLNCATLRFAHKTRPQNSQPTPLWFGFSKNHTRVAVIAELSYRIASDCKSVHVVWGQELYLVHVGCIDVTVTMFGR